MSRQVLFLTPCQPLATAPWPQPPPNALFLSPVSAPPPAPILAPPAAPMLTPVLVPAPTFVPSGMSLVPTSGPPPAYPMFSVHTGAPAEFRISVNPHCPYHEHPSSTPNSTDEERGRQRTPGGHAAPNSGEDRTRSSSEPRPNSPSRNTPAHVYQTEPQVGEDLLATQALRDLYRSKPALHGKIWQCIATQLSKPGVLRARVIVDGLECPSLYTPAGDFGQEVARTLEPHIQDYVMIETGREQYEEYRGAIMDLACIAYRTVGIPAIMRAQEARRQ
ncbi:hypothetical protein F5Y05DRAFT_423523 [Hypoxylon sp. FL0543]|nr:hypothetical protein F5Y05DRAFT_423523 [Hypoxylon sp. FL0543]